MLTQYLPILIFLVVAGGLGIVLIVIGFSAGTLLGVRRPDPAKLSQYEWAVALDSIGTFGLVAMLGVFLPILTVGFVYEWKKGALEWD